MFKAFEEKLSWMLIIRLSPLVFIIHDSEEILTIEGWMIRNISKFPAFLRDSMGINTMQFTAAVMLLFVSFVVLSFFASRNSANSVSFKIYTIIAAGLFVNGITHVIQALVLRGYIPGIVTSIIILIPFYAFVLYKLLKEKILPLKTIIVYAFITLVLQGVIATAAKVLGKLIA